MNKILERRVAGRLVSKVMPLFARDVVSDNGGRLRNLLFVVAREGYRDAVRRIHALRSRAAAISSLWPGASHLTENWRQEVRLFSLGFLGVLLEAKSVSSSSEIQSNAQGLELWTALF